MYNNNHFTLYKDEKIIWQGKPSKDRILNDNDMRNFNGMFLWIGVLWFIFCITMLLGKNLDVRHLIFVPFLCIGIFWFVGNVILINFNKKHVYYYLTNKRIIFFTDKESSNIPNAYFQMLPEYRSVLLDDIISLDVHAYDKGIGTLNIILNDVNRNFSLFGVENVNALHQLILKQINSKEDISDEPMTYSPVNASINTEYTSLSSTNQGKTKEHSEKNITNIITSTKEEIIWTGNPKYSYFSSINLPYIILGFSIILVMTYFVILVFKHNPSALKDFLPIIVFFMFYAFGLGMALINPYLRKRRLNKTTYVITNNSIKIYSQNYNYTHTYNFDEIKKISVQINKNNTGNIYFNLPYNMFSTFFGTSDYKSETDNCFFNIENPVYVYNLIKQCQRNKKLSENNSINSNPENYNKNYFGMNDFMQYNEKIIWSGRPRAYYDESIMNILEVFVPGIFVALFELFVIIASDFHFIAKLFIFFFTIGWLSLLIGRPTAKNTQSKNTLYVATNMGIHTFVDVKTQYYNFIWYSDINTIKVPSSKKGRGNILIYEDILSDNKENQKYFYNITSTLYKIENVENIYSIILDQKKEYDKKHPKESGKN